MMLCIAEARKAHRIGHSKQTSGDDSELLCFNCFRICRGFASGFGNLFDYFRYLFHNTYVVPNVSFNTTTLLMQSSQARIN